MEELLLLGALAFLTVGNKVGNMRTSQAGINAIIKHEGSVTDKHTDGNVYHKAYKDQAGLLTIGYGHLVDGQPMENYTGYPVAISEAAAQHLLRKDLTVAENAVNSLVTVPLTQAQFDALVSFVFNVGIGAFKNSTLLRELNQGDYTEASKQFLRWNKVTINGSKVVSAGLAKRREDESNLFGTA